MNLSHRKTILRKISNGLYIVTAMVDGAPTGAVISFLTQTSIEPPLITLGIRTDSRLYRAVEKNGILGIHFPTIDQQEMVASFFKMLENDDKTINGYPFQLNDRNVPLLDNLPMILEVQILDVVKKGDHHIVITEVINTILRKDVDVLAMHHTSWHYGG